jgi:hypothetical protein
MSTKNLHTDVYSSFIGKCQSMGRTTMPFPQVMGGCCSTSWSGHCLALSHATRGGILIAFCQVKEARSRGSLPYDTIHKTSCKRL